MQKERGHGWYDQLTCRLLGRKDDEHIFKFLVPDLDGSRRLAVLAVQLESLVRVFDHGGAPPDLRLFFVPRLEQAVGGVCDALSHLLRD